MILQAMLALAIFLAIRLVPLWPARHRGTDAFYYMLCVEAFRQQRKVPFTLPGLFLLEEDEQWYPPVFTVFLSCLPSSCLRKGYWTINHALDSLLALAVFEYCWHVAGPVAAWGMVLLYASSPHLNAEYQGLVSRPLASVLFAALLASAYLGQTVHPAWFALAVLFGAVLVYTHKLTMQLLWFFLPVLGILRAELAWPLLLLASYGLAALARPSLFIKVMRAHAEIIGFWHRNWPWLGAHALQQSPIYGSPEQGGPRFHQGRGLALAVLHSKRMLLDNPWVLCLVPAMGAQLSPREVFLLQCLAAIYAWATLTLAVPWLRCVGDGTKYIKYAMPITLCVLAPALARNSWAAWALAVPIALWHARHWYLGLKSRLHRQSPVGVFAPEIAPVLERIKETADARLLCLPTSLADAVAYKTHRPVLWGGHNYGLSRLQGFFPVVTRPLESIIEEYRLTHLLLDTGYATLESLRLEIIEKETFASGPYRLYRLAGQRP